MQSTLVLQLGVTAMSSVSTLWLDVHQHQALGILLTCLLHQHQAADSLLICLLHQHQALGILLTCILQQSLLLLM